MAASAALKSRVRRPNYLNKLTRAEDLIDLFPHNAYVGWSGFTGVGYPKSVSLEVSVLNPSNTTTGKSLQLSPTMSRKMAYKASSSTTFSWVPRPEQKRRTDGHD